MPHSSTFRSEVRRRDRRKVYAVDDLQDEGRSDSSPPSATMKESLEESCSSRAVALARGESERYESKAATVGGRVGVRVDDRNSSHEALATAAAGAAAAVANLGGVGPGAEPPVAVASHAFAHEEQHTETLLSNRSDKQEKDGAGASFPDDERVRVLSSEDDVGVSGRDDRGGNVEPSRTCQSGKEDTAGSRPESTNTNNEEEAETLPDSFNLSDEYGLEGASTGRNRHNDDDDYVQQVGEPVFFGLDVESTSSGNGGERSRGRGRPAARRHSRTRRDDDDFSSDYEPQQEKEGEEVYASASDSDCWPSSSREGQISYGHRSPQQQLRFGRNALLNSRRPLLTAKRRNSRVVPIEGVRERRAGESEEMRESEGTRRHRRGGSTNGAQYRSPPPRRRPRGSEDDNHRRRGRRGVSGYNSQDSMRLAQTETRSMSGEANARFEAEMARLRRENEALKQQQERSTRSSDGGVDREPWPTQDPDGHLMLQRSPQRSTRWHEPPVCKARHRKRLIRQNDAPRALERRRDRSPGRASNPENSEIPLAPSSSRRERQDGFAPRAASATNWSDFVLRSKPSPQNMGPVAWEGEGLKTPAGEVDFCLPRILVEGGFLWKLPYHNAGTPKRRWFQIKPAVGLLATASGRLVVRPRVAGGALGVSLWDGDSACSERGGGGGSGEGAVTTMPMMRLRAAWPLAFIWVDPEKDLKRSPPREMLIEEIVDLARGHKTPAFWQQAAHRGIHTLPDPKLCFSLVEHDRTLDLAAETLSEAKEWVRALARVTLMVKRGDVSCYRSQLEQVAYSDRELRSMETAEDDADMLCSVRARRQRPSGAVRPLYEDPPQSDLSARSEAGSITPLLGEGGTWSVDTIRAWRRRLFPAVTRGDVPAVLALFDQGCPVDLAQTGTGDTPMLLACRLGDIEMTRECLRRGSRNDPHPEFGQTALHAAVASGQEACARLLLETAAPSRSDAVISNHKDPNKETPLHVACRGGHSGIVDALLYHGADMRAVDKRGNTPLHGAAGGGYANALASLLDAGGDSVLEERNARGDRALHAAAASGHIACVELLLGIAAEPDLPNKEGQTPFALASRGGHLAVTKLIRQYAPAAGTPLGGDAQFQALQLRSLKGGSATADALPRPHASGSASSGPGTPDHRSQDLEHRCYSAAGLDQRKFNTSAGGSDTFPSGRPANKTGADVVERGFTQGGEGQHKSCSEVYGHDGESLVPAVPRAAVGDEQFVCSPPPSPSAPVHGSLFDGLQVYVVGGRQPLGSQHASGAAGAGMLSARSAHSATTARTMVLNSHRRSTSSRNHQHQQWEQPQEHPPNCSPSNQQASLVPASIASVTSGILDPNWKGHVLSAPSTLAPSPPLAVHSNAGMSEGASTALLLAMGSTGTPRAGGSDTSHAGVPGSARALARMMHFSCDNSHTAPLSADTMDSPGHGSTARGAVGSTLPASASSDGNVAVEITGAGVGSASLTGGGGGEEEAEETPTEAIGSWMASGDHDQDNLMSGSAARIPNLGQYGDEDENSGVAEATFSGGVNSQTNSGRWVSDSGTAGRDGVAEERVSKGELSFVVKPSDEQTDRPKGGDASVPLAGLWRVFESQGYPYYLHEASGHSQWEDPREHEMFRCQELRSTVVATYVPSDVQDQVSNRSLERKEGAVREERGVDMAPKAAGGTSKKIHRGCPPPASPIKPTGVPVAVKVSRYDTAAVSQSAEEVTEYVDGSSASGKNTGQESDNGEFIATTLEGIPGRTTSLDSCDFRSIDMASFQGSNGSGTEERVSLPSMTEDKAAASNDDDTPKSEGRSYDSDGGSCQDIGGNTARVSSSSSTDTTTSGDASSQGKREDTNEEARGEPRHEEIKNAELSIPANRTGLSIESSTHGTRTDHDDERQEQEEGVEEEWWQELDDETSGDTQL